MYAERRHRRRGRRADAVPGDRSGARPAGAARAVRRRSLPAGQPAQRRPATRWSATGSPCTSRRSSARPRRRPAQPHVAPWLSIRAVGGAVNDVDPMATAVRPPPPDVQRQLRRRAPSRVRRPLGRLRPHLDGLYLSFETDQPPERLHDAFPGETLTRLRELKAVTTPTTCSTRTSRSGRQRSARHRDRRVEVEAPRAADRGRLTSTCACSVCTPIGSGRMNATHPCPPKRMISPGVPPNTGFSGITTRPGSMNTPKRGSRDRDRRRSVELERGLRHQPISLPAAQRGLQRIVGVVRGRLHIAGLDRRGGVEDPVPSFTGQSPP